MSENEPTVDQLQERIQELEKQLEEAQKDDDFNDLKKKYEETIESKNKEINELNKTLKLKDEKVDETINNLNDEVSEKLQQSEKLRELQKNVDELLTEKAEVTVDTYIQKGVIPVAKRDIAVKLCLNDNDTFMELYRDAKPIVEVDKQKSRKINADVSRLVDYFKN